MDAPIFNALLASTHYLALALGFWGLSERTISAKKLANDPSRQDQWLPVIFRSDNLWGIASLLWIASGLMRAFGGYEKAPEFFVSNGFFHAKISVFAVIFAVELMPMIRLIRARLEFRHNPNVAPLSPQILRGIYRSGMIEIHLLVVMVIFASLMSRGVWVWS
jgi:putative membrane protein